MVNDMPRFRLPRGNQSSPRSVQGRMNIFRSVIQESSQLLDQLCHDPTMPERADYASNDEWLHAMLTSSLDQAPDLSDLFGSSSSSDGTDDDHSTTSKDASGWSFCCPIPSCRGYNFAFGGEIHVRYDLDLCNP